MCAGAGSRGGDRCCLAVGLGREPPGAKTWVFDRHREGQGRGRADGMADSVKVTAGSPVSRAPPASHTLAFPSHSAPALSHIHAHGVGPRALRLAWSGPLGTPGN